MQTLPKLKISKGVKIFCYTLLIILISIFQMSFLSHFDFLKNINLLLIIIIFTTATNYPLSLIGAIVGGFLLDIYSNFQFGSSIISLVLTVIIIKNIFNNYFSKHHFFTYPVIGFIGVLSYNFILALFISFFYLIKINEFNFILDKVYLINLIWQIILSIICIILLDLLTILIYTKLKKFFLLKN
ncbi:hypothetical protein HY750_01565 [Candidatus Kuenenbacteria bacterium]|nr:hypothetical protein [Candidatus Kuenenbacteria bacterium]